MTLVVVDAAGRLSEFIAVPRPSQDQAAPFTALATLFELAGLPMADFTPASPKWVPTVHAEQRVAWEGRLADVPDQTIRVEAGATQGKPVFFAVTGSWSRSSRTPSAAPASLFTRVVGALATFVMPALMLVGPVLAYRNVKLGRGDRRGAFRAASVVFVLQMAVWTLGSMHVASFDAEQDRLFSAIGLALFRAGLLWLTYLGLEPYVRRIAPESLVGWQRLVGGGWRDSRVGRDVMIGVAAGMAMTLVYAVHNPLVAWFGRPEPMPTMIGVDYLMSLGYTVANVLAIAQSAILNGMLGTAGYVVFRLLFKRRSAAAAAAIACFVWVVLQGMFNPGWPLLDFVCGLAITAIFVATIGWSGLLATIAALATHFLLLRAPVTTDLSSWRAESGLVCLGAILVAGLCGAYLSSRPSLQPSVR